MGSNSEDLGSGRRGSGVPECPDPLVWYEIASGQELSRSPQYIQHATDCDSCATLLKNAVSDLHDETSTSEASQIADLESAQPGWQRRLARRIAGTITPDTEPVSWWSRWRMRRFALAAAALAVVVIVAQQTQLQMAEELLARAYTAERPMELRMSGASPAKLSNKRGQEESRLDRPPSLLLAEALIALQGSRSSDPRWLQAKGRADLLDGKYDAARESLNRALQLSPKSPGILIDLATAYSQNGDHAQAFETLSQALALSPNNPVALFNRAIVGEQLHLYRQALDDAERYLQIEPHSEWASEASARVDSIRATLEKHDQSHAAPLLSPAQLAASASNPSLRAEVDERIEEYLNDAVISWLPQAYPETSSKEDPAARQALFFLADLTSQRHHDRWLSDLLSGSSSTLFRPAVVALARAVRANDAGEYDSATGQSVRAQRLFRASGNPAGALRTQFEGILAAQMTRRGESCRQQANAALAESSHYSYAWVHIQFELEKGVCSFLMGDIGADQRASGRAAEMAQRNGYPVLRLRAVFFAATDKLATGDQSAAGKLASAALANFWSGQFPAMRGYNLYVLESDIAQGSDWPNLQMATWREATALVDSGEDLLTLAWAHNSMANAATAAHRPEVAELQYAEAARLFALAPRTEASRNYAIETGIRIARLEARFGRFDAAIGRLASIQNQVLPLSNNYLAQMFYSTLGEVELRSHREEAAEQALRPALALAEQSLTSLRSEAERISWSKDAAPAYLALTEAELVLGRPQDALEIYEWYLAAPQRAAGAQPRRSPTATPMPRPQLLSPLLPLLSRETVLAYAALPGGLAIWAYDDRGVYARWIPMKVEDLQELAGRFQDLSSDPKSEKSALRRDARSLYQAFIAPVEQRLAPGRTLVIEAEGWLARVPFEALVDANDHYLIERTPIVHSLGQDSQARLHDDIAISADLAAMIVGSTASSPSDGLVPLPDVAAEADSVAGGFRSPSVLKGSDATFNAVRNQLSAAQVFHFAGHSLSTPDKTGLMLISGDPASSTPLVLDAETVRRIKVPRLRLAVLSACSTAGRSSGSRGFNSITEALLGAGAPHVVASRWAVDSVEARLFMEDFYRNALAGQSVSDAIRLSSRKMLSNPRTSHPYYWSAFAAYGRP